MRGDRYGDFLCALCSHRKGSHNGLSCGEPQCLCTGFQPSPTCATTEPRCFDCGDINCELVGETYAFCNEACRDAFMAGLGL